MSKQKLSVLAKAARVSITATAAAAILPVAVTLLAAESHRPPHTPSAVVVSYDPGVGAVPRFTDPRAALGAPSQINPFGEPTDPFNPPYGTNQIVSVGAGGHLALQFHTPILNHPNNLAGLDFTLFGNTGFIITNEFDLTSFDWVGIPATDGTMFGFSTGEILVSASRNGEEYFLLDPAQSPAVDHFPPTDGAGDPGVPVAPGLTPADFVGTTLAELRALYQGSAGGASFDLDAALDSRGQSVFLPEIRFIRIDVLSGRAEIDAISAVNRVSRGRP